MAERFVRRGTSAHRLSRRLRPSCQSPLCSPWKVFGPGGKEGHARVFIGRGCAGSVVATGAVNAETAVPGPIGEAALAPPLWLSSQHAHRHTKGAMSRSGFKKRRRVNCYRIVPLWRRKSVTLLLHTLEGLGMDSEKKPSEQTAEEPKKDIGEIVGELAVSGATVLAHTAAEDV